MHSTPHVCRKEVKWDLSSYNLLSHSSTISFPFSLHDYVLLKNFKSALLVSDFRNEWQRNIVKRVIWNFNIILCAEI